MKLAPEHASDDVLRLMNKPRFEKYEQFEDRYRKACGEIGKDQYLVNYFIAGHPGTTLKAAVDLFEKLVSRNYSPEQVQEFIPLPMTRAGVQYAAGIDPITKGNGLRPQGGPRAAAPQGAHAVEVPRESQPLRGGAARAWDARI